MVESEIRSIVTGMPQLKVVEWSLAEKFPQDFDISLAGTFELILRRGALQPIPPAAAAQTENEGHAQVSRPRLGIFCLPNANANRNSAPPAPAEDLEPSSSISDPLIIAKLHPKDVLKVLATAPLDEVRDAWLEGRQIGSGEGEMRRLRLEECCAVASTRPTRDSTSEAWGRMYEEGREWWLREK